jgi:leader peptidase (prepilin peptidase)/N-methyltransferase
VLVLLRPGKLGAGDLKLAGVLGLALGWLGWPAVLRGTLLTFALLSICSLALLATRRIRLDSALSFGPFMLAGALLAVLRTVP